MHSDIHIVDRPVVTKHVGVRVTRLAVRQNFVFLHRQNQVGVIAQHHVGSGFLHQFPEALG